eukprot:CAMPEP_0113310748 /NCGR_PEP_ID=MMETSP0010_2-20120614/8271_1 /TAXON_ID=216773 ORGANISM="Corethron hystrix, Strain 308" /NCGR_SAMPLE_ID=MMETSP0010_2 /ASSEMBLY_ACC=CAM_ASM_000155 /LENGTH=543 /DNA_ID=CAMNT_0000166269 /DNA_START=415 /DNA_END=2046 /DNA_ORIENTATION=- /assembly_acc=CAM_ASM_000155
MKNKDITPVLGRGYSIGVGGFHSVCMHVPVITQPTEDYQYVFVEIKGEISEEMNQDPMSGSPALAPASVNVENERMSRSGSGSVHVMVGYMKVERYYTSVDESAAPLIGEAVSLLQSKSIIQFFQACGPNYIRSIRRTSDITAVFIYVSASKQSDSAFAGDMNSSAKGKEADRRHRFSGGRLGQGKRSAGKKKFERTSVSAYAEGLVIFIWAFGLGSIPATEGSRLNASNMNEYAAVMNTAFESMKNPLAGQVRTVETVPWTFNAAFQNALDVSKPLVRSAYLCYRNADGDTVFANGTLTECFDTRNAAQTKTCGYDAQDNEYFDPFKCRIERSEDAVLPELRKFNLVANGEFISNIALKIRKDMMAMQIHLNCVSELLKLNRGGWDDKLLFNRRLNRFEPGFVFFDVKTLLHKLMYGDSVDYVPLADDPALTGNYLMVTKLNDIKNLIIGFFEPCMLKMGEEKYNTVNGAMQMFHWTTITECSKLKCTFPGFTWNNSMSDCVASDADTIGLQYRLDEYCPPTLRDWLKNDGSEGQAVRQIEN